MKEKKEFDWKRWNKQNIIVMLIFAIVIFSILTFAIVISKRIEYPWYFDSLMLNEFRILEKNKTIGVAIIDSGFDDDFKDYFVNEVIKYDVTGEESYKDSTGHGSQMALLIGSNSTVDNSVYGMNPYVQIYSIRVTNFLGITTTEYLHSAFELCKTLDVSIVNVSLGGNTYDETIEADISYLKERNVFVNCASGDSNDEFLYPADYKDSYCIAAQRSDSNIFEKANTTSRIGKKYIKSPGVDIDVLIKGGDGSIYIDRRNGSSYATAIFSGYISLILARNKSTMAEFDKMLADDSLYENGFLGLLIFRSVTEAFT